MKMTRKCLSALLAGLAMLFVSCNVKGGEYKTIEFKLQGTWESTDTALYYGKLIIDLDTITITGYAEFQTPWNGDDDKRPFRDFAKNAPLPCYSEDGKLFIMAGGGEKSVPYYYYTAGQNKYLLFTFGGRDEILKKTGN